MKTEDEKKIDQVIERLDGTMTPEQARDLLKRNGYCPKHGIKLEERVVRSAYPGKWKGERTEQFCTECEFEALELEKKRQARLDSQIEQAKRVLGL